VALDGAHRAAQQLGDVSFGEVLVVSKNNAGTLPIREATHGLPQGIVALLHVRRVACLTPSPESARPYLHSQPPEVASPDVNRPGLLGGSDL